jgi:heme exporter protein B
MRPEALAPLALALLAGTPAVSMLGAVGAALLVGVRRGGALLGLLTLPFYIPVLIFGTAAVNGLADGGGGLAQIYWLAAMSVLAATLAPFAVWAALKISVENG